MTSEGLLSFFYLLSIHTFTLAVRGHDMIQHNDVIHGSCHHFVVRVQTRILCCILFCHAVNRTLCWLRSGNG